MTLQSPPIFTTTDCPNADPAMLDLLNRGFRQLYAALSDVPDIKEAVGQKFTTSASGTAYLDLKTDTPPTHLWVTDLEAADKSSIATAWSQTWVRRNECTRVLFAGLSASKKYTCSVLYR